MKGSLGYVFARTSGSAKKLIQWVDAVRTYVGRMKLFSVAKIVPAPAATHSPYQVFCELKRPLIKASNPEYSSHAIEEELGAMWQSLSNDEKRDFMPQENQTLPVITNDNVTSCNATKACYPHHIEAKILVADRVQATLVQLAQDSNKSETARAAY